MSVLSLLYQKYQIIYCVDITIVYLFCLERLFTNIYGDKTTSSLCDSPIVYRKTKGFHIDNSIVYDSLETFDISPLIDNFYYLNSSVTDLYTLISFPYLFQISFFFVNKTHTDEISQFHTYQLFLRETQIPAETRS